MCLSRKKVDSFNAITSKLNRGMPITKAEYEFLKNNGYPVDSFNLKEKVSFLN